MVDRLELRKLSQAFHIIFRCCIWTYALRLNPISALFLCNCKVLPWKVIFAIDGSLEDPISRPWRISRLDDDVGHLVHLQSDWQLLNAAQQFNGRVDRMYCIPACSDNGNGLNVSCSILNCQKVPLLRYVNVLHEW